MGQTRWVNLIQTQLLIKFPTLKPREYIKRLKKKQILSNGMVVGANHAVITEIDIGKRTCYILLTQEFAGNTDSHTVVSHDLIPPITTRYIRFQIITWYAHASMRAEVYGCHGNIIFILLSFFLSKRDSQLIISCLKSFHIRQNWCSVSQSAFNSPEALFR